MSSRNRVAARAAVKAIAAALLVALMCAPAASAQPTQLCSSVKLPMASLFVATPIANAVFRNVTANFTALGWPTTTSPSDCVTPHGTWIVKWEFDWDGDGTVDKTVFQNGMSLSQSFTYTALKSGNEARLRVTDDLGNSSSWAFTLFNIVNKPPTASLTGGTGYRNEAITLSGSGSTDVDGPIKSYHWSFDNSGHWDRSTTVSSTTYSWWSLGTWTVALQVEDSDGATSAWTTATVTIVDQPPIAAFSCSPAAPKTGETITCTSSSHDPDSNQPLSHEWDTGSGYSSGWSTNTTVSFSHSGSHTIRLRVTDNDHLTAATQQLVTVANRAPVAAFVTDPAPFYTGQLMTLRSTSSDPDGLIAATYWDLDGDGSYGDATGTTVARRYTTTVAHEIGLRVWDNEGEAAVFRQYVQATVPPPDAPVSASLDRLADTHRDLVELTWMPSHSGAVKYDVRWCQMLKDSASYGPWQTVINGTTNKSARHTLPSGATACYSVRAYNAAGVASAWSGERCTSNGRGSRRRSAGTGTP